MTYNEVRSLMTSSLIPHACRSCRATSSVQGTLSEINFFLPVKTINFPMEFGAVCVLFWFGLRVAVLIYCSSCSLPRSTSIKTLLENSHSLKLIFHPCKMQGDHDGRMNANPLKKYQTRHLIALNHRWFVLKLQRCHTTTGWLSQKGVIAVLWIIVQRGTLVVR